MKPTNWKNDGRSFEKSLQQICRIYAEQGRAKFEKVEPPTRTIGAGHFRKVIYLPNPFLDFQGCWTTAGNRACAFEAKSTTDPTLPCGDDYGFSQAQRDAMRDWRAAGAATWLLWEMSGAVRLFTHDMVQAGMAERKSLVWADGIEVEAGKGFVFYDFLTTAKRYEAFL